MERGGFGSDEWGGEDVYGWFGRCDGWRLEGVLVFRFLVVLFIYFIWNFYI